MHLLLHILGPSCLSSAEEPNETGQGRDFHAYIYDGAMKEKREQMPRFISLSGGKLQASMMDDWLSAFYIHEAAY